MTANIHTVESIWSQLPDLEAICTATVSSQLAGWETTIPEMALVLDMTEDGVNYHLRRLQAAGLLRREGCRSAGHWVVTQAPNDGATP